MIDFIKIHLVDTNLDYLEAHSLLDYISEVNNETGEVKNIKKAYYNGLEFKFYSITDKTPHRRLTVEGSLHKYWNNGAHNFNDFGIFEVLEVLKDLENTFKIKASNSILRQLEIGVNIHPPIKTKLVLHCCIMSKTKELKSIFTKDEGSYLQSKNQRHFIKIYDKKTHYANKGFQIENETMRIEKKWCKMVELNSRGIYTLDDLIRHGLDRFKGDLVKLWQDVLFCDLNTLKETRHNNKYNNINWWRQQPYEKFKYHRNNLNKLIKSDQDNLKNVIENLIIEKVDLLNPKTPEINPLYIRLKTVELDTNNINQNRRTCLVTGLNISMQKKTSILLSHTGLKYYYKTDKKIFNEIKRKHLSNKWLNANEKIIIKELAHNIRNKYYNNRKNTNQLSLFQVA